MAVAKRLISNTQTIKTLMISSRATEKRGSIRAMLADALPWLGSNTMDAVAPLFVRQEIEKWSVLLRQGELSTKVYIVERGVLRLYIGGDDGREFNKNFFAEGSMVLPLTTKMMRAPSLFAIAALESGAVQVADYSAFKGALGSSSWHTVQRKMLAGLLDHKLQREHEFLARSGRERYQIFCEECPGLSGRIPVGHLASYLGLTNVSLSRIRHSKQGAKSAPRRIQRTR